ncbi:MAG: response regulator [Acidobacteria bacterium]|nr:response regulator [Acidobacteriota bacterium]
MTQQSCGRTSEAAKPVRRVLAAVQDLFFRTKISAAANHVGVPVEFVPDEASLRQKADIAPILLILDLNHTTLDPIRLIRHLKEKPAGNEVLILGYLSHVQQQLRLEAEKAGCDVVLPRSVFSKNLDEILRQRSCHL